MAALTFGEILATSDVPGGVVNILSGPRSDIAPTAATHMDVNAIVNGCEDTALDKTLHEGTATNLKRYARHTVPVGDWRVADRLQWIWDTIKFKSAGHPIGWRGPTTAAFVFIRCSAKGDYFSGGNCKNISQSFLDGRESST